MGSSNLGDGLRLAAEVVAARGGARMVVPVPTYPLAAQCFVEAGLQVEEVASATCAGRLPSPAEAARSSMPA